MHTYLAATIVLLVSITADARHHTVSLAPHDSSLRDLRPAVHEVDIDILGFTADITVYERYPLDSTARGRLLLAFGGSERRELIACTIALDDGQGRTIAVPDEPGLSLLQGPNVDGHSSVMLELRYIELLPRSRGQYTLSYVPPSCMPADNAQDDVPSHPIWISLSLTAGMPIDDIACISHDARIWYDGARSAHVLPDLESAHDSEPFVVRYALDGEDLVQDVNIFEAPDGELFFMMVSPEEQTEEMLQDQPHARTEHQ